MSASAVGYALIADSNRDPLVVGLVVALVGAVVAVITTMMSNASANRRQRIELRHRKGNSGLVGFLFGIIAILIVGLIVVATRPDEKPTVESAGPTPPSATVPAAAETVGPTAVPTVSPTPLPTEQPISLEEASAVVSAFVANAKSPETQDQAWAMYSEAHQADLTAHNGGIEGFKRFWQSVETVEAPPDKPFALTESTSARAVLVAYLNYLLHPNSNGVQKCTVETDTFVLIRTNGTLRIDEYLPDAEDCPSP